ncbi:hypothetical protein BLNAU_8298 [Blattamonas nauphoetae]|uniref:Uncharacterized protein n=1 Tax=Blattamonas nauphoetae TaxID=2049346 RepID=A0ABQ9XYY7_9EUKA|nr:hypothetical protein BLNAU_8298 [Blattamonas nauphoetae]
MDLDIQDALLETRDINRRNHNADIDKIIEIRRKQEQDRIAREKKQKEEEEEDMGPPEIFIRRLDPNLKKGLTVVDSSSNNPFSNHKSTPSLQTQAPVPRGIPASIMPDYPTTVQHSTDSSAFNRPTPMLSLVSNREPQTPFISHNPDQPAMEPLEVPVDDHEYQSFVAYRPNLLSFSEDEDEEAEEDMFKLPASSKKKQDVQPQPEPQPQPEIQKTKRQSSDDGEAVPVKKIQKEVPETFSKLAALLDYSDSEDDD